MNPWTLLLNILGWTLLAFFVITLGVAILIGLISGFKKPHARRKGLNLPPWGQFETSALLKARENYQGEQLFGGECEKAFTAGAMWAFLEISRLNQAGKPSRSKSLGVNIGPRRT